MKKFIFSALACVAFAGSAFASNEIAKEKLSNLNEVINVELFTSNNLDSFNVVAADTKPCSFLITGRDVYGKPFSTRYNVEGNTTSAGCDATRDAKVKQLKELGATIDKVDTTWG